MSDILQKRIKYRLEVLQKSAAGASLEAGLGRSAVTDILAGNSGSPRLHTLESIARALQCSVAYLIGASDVVGEFAEPGINAWAEDPIPEPIAGAIAAGVFRERDDRPYRARRYGVGVAYRDKRFPDWPVSLYRVQDDSVEDEGIFEGDLITVTAPADEEIVLKGGMLVLVERRFEGLTETTLKRVELRNNEMHLVSRSTADEMRERRIVIPTSDLSLPDRTGVLANSYMDADGNSVDISGIAVRLVRDLPT